MTSTQEAGRRAPLPPDAEPDPALPARIRGVTRTYGAVTAVEDVSFDVAAGEIVGLLGANGAGKSTLLQLLCGLRRPTRGRVQLFGGDPRVARYRRALGATPQETGLPPTLRVGEVLDLAARHYPDPAPVAELLERFDLGGLARRQTGGLSGGQQRRVALALAFAGRPRLVLLDEPTTGLDVTARHTVWDAVRAYRAAGGTVVLSSHHFDEIEALVDRVVVLDRGRVRLDDTPDVLRSTVARRRVRVRAAALPELPGVLRTESEGDLHEMWTTDSDALVRRLVESGAPFRDLDVEAASLEGAFVALTGNAGAETETETETAAVAS